MNGDFMIDMSEIMNNVDTAEILAMYFPLIRKTLLMDTRADSLEGAMIKVVPMVNSIEDRFKSIRKLRPRFPRPESITIIPWPKYVSSLQRLGIWDKIVQRLIASGDTNAVRAANEAYNELLKYEKEELMAAIKGEHYQSLWETKSS